MSSFSAIVCDHCDVRDVLEHPPVNGIKGVIVSLTVGSNNPKTYAKIDLCEKCVVDLDIAIINGITQIPRQA